MPLARLRVLAPGILIAATGVGAGDLLMASLGGSAVGLALLWAAAAGAVLKWFLNEGIARRQMATGTTLLEGWIERLGSWVQWLFLVYLAGWTLFAGGALITACGVAGTGLLPLTDDLVVSKRIWGVVHSLAGQLALALGSFGKWAFLVGFWGAVFSSLLGVWQGVPYLFADFLAVRRGLSRSEREALDFTRTRPYRIHLLALALAPLPVLWISVRQAQLAYAVLGSLFMPLLAATLLLLNNRTRWVGERFRNGALANLALAVTLAFFAFAGLREAARSFAALVAGGS